MKNQDRIGSRANPNCDECLGFGIYPVDDKESGDLYTWRYNGKTNIKIFSRVCRTCFSKEHKTQKKEE
jgi:hypothetical protein